MSGSVFRVAFRIMESVPVMFRIRIFTPERTPGLNVRYRVDQNNTDKWSGVVGMTFGLKRGIGVITEPAFGENSHRYMASAYHRF